MENQTQNVTLYVDGSVLKKHMIAEGQSQTPQAIVQSLTHMVRAIRQQNPGALVNIEYYGARLTDVIRLPVSGGLYRELETKLALKHCRIPGAVIHSSWGRVSYPFDQAWILKPESFGKMNRTDADFVLNEKPKGVLAQLVCQMTKDAVCSPETPMYVYGDEQDMGYALHTAKWLGANVRQIELIEGRPFIGEIAMTKEPHPCDKTRLHQVGDFISPQRDVAASLRNMRAKCPAKDKQSVLMLDMGVIRKYLEQSGCRMSVQNVNQVLSQITSSLPEPPTKTVLYCAFSTPRKLVSPFPGETRALLDSSAEKQILSIPNVEVSAGKTVQDKWYPFILKKDKWLTPMEFWGYKDLDYNFHQCDVDDRIACDIALYGMDPTVSQLYLLATDGDFACPVEKVAEMGLPTSLIHFDAGVNDVSFRLQRGAETTIRVLPDAAVLTSREKEEEDKREAQKIRVDTKRKKLQKLRRQWARAAGDYIGPKATKSERWAEARGAHRREVYGHIQRRQ